jgi:hypothetical protein
VLLAMMAWVALGHGFPGGSVMRRMTGQEGPTGGLTTAMRAMLRGDFAAGRARHGAAPWVFAYTMVQLVWRGVIVLARPRLAAQTWVVDLIASMTLFAACIYVPWWTR